MVANRAHPNETKSSWRQLCTMSVAISSPKTLWRQGGDDDDGDCNTARFIDDRILNCRLSQLFISFYMYVGVCRTKPKNSCFVSAGKYWSKLSIRLISIDLNKIETWKSLYNIPLEETRSGSYDRISEITFQLPNNLCESLINYIILLLL